VYNGDTLTGPTHIGLTGITDDGNICTTGENCNNGVFIPGVATFVDDNDICTFDECNSITGAITHTPVSWDDGNACTRDYCNTLTGVAVHAPTPTVFIGSDTTLNSGSTLILDAGPGYSYLWSTGETTQSITINTTGLYSVTIMDQNGCIGSDAILITLPTLITPFEKKTNLSVFPNPSQGRFKIQFSEPAKYCRMEVINILNQIVYQLEERNINTSQIREFDLNLPKGTYLLHFVFEETSVRKYLVVN
jgi:Secretion system C-terminal sorting domain/Dictyostelium (slime mold) repeat